MGSEGVREGQDESGSRGVGVRKGVGVREGLSKGGLGEVREGWRIRKG